MGDLCFRKKNNSGYSIKLESKCEGKITASYKHILGDR